VLPGETRVAVFGSESTSPRRGVKCSPPLAFLRLDGNLQRLQTMWQTLFVDMKSMQSWQYLMRDITVIKTWNVTMVTTPYEREADAPTRPLSCYKLPGVQ